MRFLIASRLVIFQLKRLNLATEHGELYWLGGSVLNITLKTNLNMMVPSTCDILFVMGFYRETYGKFGWGVPCETSWLVSNDVKIPLTFPGKCTS